MVSFTRNEGTVISAPNLSEHPGGDQTPSNIPAELGWGSLIMAAVLFLSAPITLVLAALVWQFADHSPGSVLLHANLARIGDLLGIFWWGLRASRLQSKGRVAAERGISLQFLLWPDSCWA
jgi:hypothetical protein